MNTKTALRRYGPVFVWALLILALSSIPDLSSAGNEFRMRDKLVHFVEYGILGYLLASAWIPAGAAGLRWKIAAVLVVGFLFGCVDELYQSLIPGRSTDPFDVAADALGVMAAVVVWRIWGDRPIQFLRRRPFV
jgi:VanZ family protein